DLGSHGGTLARKLAQHRQIGQVLATDPSPEMAQRAGHGGGVLSLASGMEHVPFARDSLDLVASVASLHWVNDLPGVMVQVREALRPDGLFLAALFGGGTLAELRAVLTEAETRLRGGVSPRLSPLPGLADVAGLMQRTGFALPVVDSETVTVRYDNMFRLLADLRGMGEQAAFPADRTAPLRRDVLEAAAHAYQDRFADPDGRIRATFQVIWLSGWAPAPSQPQPLRPGSAKTSLAAAVGATERSAGEKAGGDRAGDDKAGGEADAGED
ncbi:MAG: methyltransferase domain-containing protein, partial [Pseudomonadota bacterium]